VWAGRRRLGLSIEEHDIARAFRDPRLFRVGGGTTETMRHHVAKLIGL
jgi:citronellyl-CoA dehydrogenase